MEMVHEKRKEPRKHVHLATENVYSLALKHLVLNPSLFIHASDNEIELFHYHYPFHQGSSVLITV